VSSHLLSNLSRGLFIVTLAYAPWAYGCTTTTSIATLKWLLFATLVLWVADLMFRRRIPKFPPLLLTCIALLIAMGAWMVFNASAICDSDFHGFAALAQPAPRLPGSIDYALSAAWMIRVVLLLGIVLFVVDLAQNDRWLLRLWYAIGGIGGSVALLGLLEKATGAQMIFWQPAPRFPISSAFFASYYYHGNAGAYLNLILPVTAGLAVRSFMTRNGPMGRAIWLITFVLVLVAVAANTSRMAQLIALVLLLGSAWQLARRIARTLSSTEKNLALPGAAAILVALLAVAQASHLEKPIQRWETVKVTEDARWLAATVAIRSIPQAGAFGFGPGTFRAAFPWLNEAASVHAPGYWRFLHEDYLQVALEWGWVGSLLWAVLFFGGIFVAIRTYRAGTSRKWTPRRRLLLPLTVIALCGVALHGLVDFPLQIASIQLYVATYLGMCWSAKTWAA
jgi:hypothetical protein